jgi:hypothetical protein
MLTIETRYQIKEKEKERDFKAKGAKAGVNESAR